MNDPLFDNVYIVTRDGLVEDVCATLEVAKIFANGSISDESYKRFTWHLLVDIEEDQRSWRPAEDEGDGWDITEWSVRNMVAPEDLY